VDEDEKALIDCVNAQIRSGANTVEIPVALMEAAATEAAQDALDLCRVNNVDYVLVAG
jgi:hypothetical protein